MSKFQNYPEFDACMIMPDVLVIQCFPYLDHTISMKHSFILTVKVEFHLSCSAYKDAESLSELVRTQLLRSQDELAGQRSATERPVQNVESTPLRGPESTDNPGHGSRSFL